MATAVTYIFINITKVRPKIDQQQMTDRLTNQPTNAAYYMDIVSLELTNALSQAKIWRRVVWPK
jgi:hypothetical protein